MSKKNNWRHYHLERNGNRRRAVAPGLPDLAV